MSREFWMFVGSLLLIISAIHITLQTSLPVTNKFLEPFSGFFTVGAEIHIEATRKLNWTRRCASKRSLSALAAHNFTPSGNIDNDYHKIQVPLAILIFIFMGLAQWMKYKKSSPSKVFPKLARALIGSIAITFLLMMSFTFKTHEYPRVALLFATSFAVLSNADFIWSLVRGKLDKWGSPLAHIGFALTIFGAVISTAEKQFISSNQIGDISSLNSEFKNNEDLLLMQGDTLLMGDYFVTYTDRRTSGIHVFFDMVYFDRGSYNYSEGDIVVFKDLVYQAKENHTASYYFLDDAEKYWTPLPFPTKNQASRAQPWKMEYLGIHYLHLALESS